MSDHTNPSFGPEPRGAPHDTVRDALPALLNGRVTVSERADLDSHLDGCAPCDAELALLARVRDAFVADAPPIAVDRIAAAVRAATVPPRPAVVTPAARVAPVTTMVPPFRRGPAWARRGAIRAFAATALVAVGSGALYLRQAVAPPAQKATPTLVGPVASAVSRPAVSAPDANQSLLGASFSDLSDSELATVVAAVGDPAATVPAAEPASMTPAGLAPDGE